MGLTNILAMDGGNGIVTADLLQKLEDVNHNRYLNRADLFVGTSAGGINSLFLASQDNPTDALQHILEFWTNVNRSILGGLSAAEVEERAKAAVEANAVLPVATQAGQDVIGAIFHSILGLGEAAFGFRSLFRNDVLKQCLTQYFGADTVLGDLRKKVIIVSFQLDNGKTGIKQSWAPKLFTNLDYGSSGQPRAPGEAQGSDMHEKIVDVALRTSAAPLELPIYQGMDGTGPGYVDGGLVANNPAMIALSAILGTLRRAAGAKAKLDLDDALSEINLLSVGTGRNLVGTAQFLDPEFSGGSAAWGYKQWLFDPSNLVVLIDAWIQGGNIAVSKQCELLMGDENFHRLNVPLQFMMAEKSPATDAVVAEAAAWLQTKNWFKQQPKLAITAQVPMLHAGKRAQFPATPGA
jgi:hypothetical protein